MPNPIKPIAQIPKDVGEAVGKPAIDEAMTVINEIPAQLFGYSTQTPPKNPQEDAKRKADEERRKQNILRYFETLKANAAGYKQQQDVLKQERIQKEMEERQKVRQFDIQAKQKRDETVFRAQRKAEIKVKGG